MRKLNHDQIFQDHLSGLSYVRISKKHNCSESAVEFIILKNKNPEKYKSYNTINSRKSRAKLAKIEQLEKIIQELTNENNKLKSLVKSTGLPSGLSQFDSRPK